MYRVYSHEIVNDKYVSRCIYRAESEDDAFKFALSQNFDHPSAMWCQGELRMLRVVDDTTLNPHVLELFPEDGGKIKISFVNLASEKFEEDYVDYDLREDLNLLFDVTGQRKPIEGYDEQKLYRQLLRRRAKDDHEK